MAATKRKRSSVRTDGTAATNGEMPPPPPKRRQSARNSSTAAATVNPDVNDEVLDAPTAARASPDADMNGDIIPGEIKQKNAVNEQEAPKPKGRG